MAIDTKIANWGKRSEPLPSHPNVNFVCIYLSIYLSKTLEEGSDQEVTEREERVRSLVKLVHCDFTADPLIERGYEGPYDLVICFLVLEVSCATIEEYHQRVVRFSSLVKPGGTLLLLTTDNQLWESLVVTRLDQRSFHT